VLLLFGRVSQDFVANLKQAIGSGRFRQEAIGLNSIVGKGSVAQNFAAGL
jgi:hypothetical protein